MRGCPSWNTISTEVVANTAPSAMMSVGHVMPRAENAVASGSAVPSCFHGSMPVSTERDHDIDDGADHQAGDDGERHVALGILGLLGGGRHRVEADVGEEDDRGRGEDARRSRWARTDASSAGLT